MRLTKKIILRNYDIDNLIEALDILYPISIKSLIQMREHQIFRKYIIEGNASKDVCVFFGISHSTINKTVSNVYAKINLFYNAPLHKYHVYDCNFTDDQYKSLDSIFGYRYSKTHDIFKKNNILFLWQLKQIKINEIVKDKANQLFICEYLKKRGIKHRDCIDRVAKYAPTSIRRNLTRGWGYNGLITSMFGCLLNSKINYQKFQILIEQLPPNEKEVIREYFFGGKSYQQIAESKNLTRERIRQILNKAQRKLKHPKSKNLYLIKKVV